MARFHIAHGACREPTSHLGRAVVLDIVQDRGIGRTFLVEEIGRGTFNAHLASEVLFHGVEIHVLVMGARQRCQALAAQPLLIAVEGFSAHGADAWHHHIGGSIQPLFNRLQHQYGSLA